MVPITMESVTAIDERSLVVAIGQKACISNFR